MTLGSLSARSSNVLWCLPPYIQYPSLLGYILEVHLDLFDLEFLFLYQKLRKYFSNFISVFAIYENTIIKISFINFLNQ